MKRIFALLAILVMFAAIPGPTATTVEAKKSMKGKTVQTRKTPTVATFKWGPTTYSLLADGKVKSSDSCLSGTYTKGKKGAYYEVIIRSTSASRCGNYMAGLLIVGSEAYLINEGEAMEYGFYYRPETGTVSITGSGTADDDALAAFMGYPSNNIHISSLENIAKVKWIKLLK